jgi:hypothetical protein
MTGKTQYSEPMWQKVLVVFLVAIGLSLIPLLLLEGEVRCLWGMIFFVLAYVAGTMYIRKFYEKNAQLTREEVDAFVLENGFIKTEYQGVRTWKFPGWGGRSRGAYSGNFKGREVILSVYSLPSSGRYHLNPVTNFETLAICVDMPLREGESPADLDSAYEHDKVAKRISGNLYGSETTKERIGAMMEYMVRSLAHKSGRGKQIKE